jgi:hypothetical protein
MLSIFWILISGCIFHMHDWTLDVHRMDMACPMATYTFEPHHAYSGLEPTIHQRMSVWP